MVKSQSPDFPFISHYAIIQGEMGIFLTFSVFELQRGYMELQRGYMDLSSAVGHVRECPHSGTRYLTFPCKKGMWKNKPSSNMNT